MRDFTASYDSMTKAVSAIAVTVILAGPFIAQSWLVGALSLLVLIATYGYSPRGYAVGQHSIRVRRLLRDAEFPLEGVTAARPVTPEDLRGTIRLWGSGGLFGYYGLFRTSALGRCTWYSTHRSNQVVVASETRTALFSPDDVEGFLAAIRTEAPALGETPAGTSSAPIAKQGIGAYAWILGAIAIPGVIFAIAVVRYSPGHPEVHLTADSLEIRDRFYPVTLKRDSVDLDTAKPVSVTDPEWRATRRTNGFANSHYRSGWFRTANGKTVRMYRAAGERLLLLPGKQDGDTVLLDVPDPDGFLRALKVQWARAPGP